MASPANTQINDVFASGSRDLTPASLPMTHVLYMPVISDPGFSSLCASVLSAEELRRSERFASEADRTHFLQRRAFRRYCGVTALESQQPLSTIVFSETKNGQPFISDLPGLRFSFSSCREGFLGAWSLTYGIGVDIEDETRKLEVTGLANQYFSGAESSIVETVKDLERLRVFYQFWSLKEAALKSIGEGLPFGLDTFEFELKPNLRVVRAPADHGGAGQFEAHLIEGTDSCAALVTRKLADRPLSH